MYNRPHFRHLSKIVFFCTVIATTLRASDTLVDKQGERTLVTIIRILPKTIEYKKASNPDGPLYVTEKCNTREILFANGSREDVSGECATPQAEEVPYKQLSTTIELPIGLFGLFNVDNNKEFTRFGTITLGVIPSAMYRYHKNFAAGLECMLLWGQVDTTDPPRFIINPNIRNEFLYPFNRSATFSLIVSGGYFSVWPIHDTTGVLHPTFFDQRFGWNIRAAFGVDWILNPSLSALVNVGYSANSSMSRDVWITHDMMMINAGVRYSFDLKKDTTAN